MSFGNSGGTSGGLFGSTNSNNTTTNQSTGSGLFGNSAQANNNSSTSLFGNSNSNNSSGGLFGNKDNSSKSGSLFGSNTNSNTANTSGGLFGNSNSGSSSTGLFGNNTNSNLPSSSGGLFGNSNNNKSSGGIFGNSTNSSKNSGGLFGSSGNSNVSSGGLFSNSSNNNSSSSGLFGTNNANAPNPTTEQQKIFNSIQQEAAKDNQDRTQLAQLFLPLFSYPDVPSLIYKKKKNTNENKSADQKLKEGLLPDELGQCFQQINTLMNTADQDITDVLKADLAEVEKVKHLVEELDQSLLLTRQSCEKYQYKTRAVLEESKNLSKVTENVLHEMRRCSSLVQVGTGNVKVNQNQASFPLVKAIPSLYLQDTLSGFEHKLIELGQAIKNIELLQENMKNSKELKSFSISKLLEMHYENFLAVAQQVAMLNEKMNSLKHVYIQKMGVDIFSKHNTKQKGISARIEREIEQTTKNADFNSLIKATLQTTASNAASKENTSFSSNPANEQKANSEKDSNKRPGLFS
eukprot:maker-scaffold_15-snap-gene-2.23-mRNA-1 protein AED:0.26 eAED:0.26 QI:191/1/1/1/1/1/2/944/518